MPAKSTVSIARSDRRDPAEIDRSVRQAIDLAGGLGDIVKPGSLVLIKPNLVVVPPGRDAGICTDVHVVKAVADAVKALGGEAVIAEASASGQDTLAAMEVMGYSLLCDSGYQIVDLERTERTTVPVPDGRVLDELETFVLAQEADAIISLPLLKTHCQADITVSLKNMMGLATAEQKIAFHHKGLFDCIGDINSVYRPAFAVVDGLRGQEGVGPTHGLPVDMNLVLAGRDLVAVDAVAGRIMAFDPETVEVIRRAHDRGLGTLDSDEIGVVGEPIEAVRRRFMRVAEDHRVHDEGVTILRGEETCTGCRNSFAFALMRLQEEEALEASEGLTILIGDVPVPEGTPLDSVVSLGRCCPEYLHGRPQHVIGCPPRGSDIVNTIEMLRSDGGSGFWCKG